MWLNLVEKYNHSLLDSVVKAKTQLDKELNELKTEIETHEILNETNIKKNFPSISFCDPIVLENERKLFIERLLKVNFYNISFIDYYVLSFDSPRLIMRVHRTCK